MVLRLHARHQERCDEKRCRDAEDETGNAGLEHGKTSQAPLLVKVAAPQTSSLIYVNGKTGRRMATGILVSSAAGRAIKR
jgi:hypothetical protein